MDTSLNKLGEFYLNTSSPLISTHYGISCPQNAHRSCDVTSPYVYTIANSSLFGRSSSRNIKVKIDRCLIGCSCKSFNASFSSTAIVSFLVHLNFCRDYVACVVLVFWQKIFCWSLSRVGDVECKLCSTFNVAIFCQHVRNKSRLPLRK